MLTLPDVAVQFSLFVGDLGILLNGQLITTHHTAAVSQSCFLPARRYASAGLCDSDVSVCLSVRLSVTRRYCAQQSESRIVKCTPSDSPVTLVSGEV